MREVRGGFCSLSCILFVHCIVLAGVRRIFNVFIFARRRHLSTVLSTAVNDADFNTNSNWLGRCSRQKETTATAKLCKWCRNSPRLIVTVKRLILLNNTFYIGLRVGQKDKDTNRRRSLTTVESTYRGELSPPLLLPSPISFLHSPPSPPWKQAPEIQFTGYREQCWKLECHQAGYAAEPQPKSNSVHFSLKMWHVTSGGNSLIFSWESTNKISCSFHCWGHSQQTTTFRGVFRIWS